MSRSSLWRRRVAVSAVMAWAVAASVFAAGPAHAAISVPLDFGSQTVGITTAPQTVTIPLRTTVDEVRPALLAAVEVIPFPPLNLGLVNLTSEQVKQVALDTVNGLDGDDGASVKVDSITVSGADAADFAVTGCAGADGAAVASCDLAATFTPLAVGPRIAQVAATVSITEQPTSLAPALTAALVNQGIPAFVASVLVAGLLPTLQDQILTVINDNLDPAALLTGSGTVNAGAGFHPVTPFRAIDSRAGLGFNGPLGPGATAAATIAGTGAVPPSASGVIMNVTATEATASSFVTVFPTGSAAPDAANLLFGSGQTVPNLVTVGIGANGRVSMFNQRGSVEIVGDVVGYFDPDPGGERFSGIAPQRLLDSRSDTGGWGSTRLGPGETRPVAVAGHAGVPPTATAVVMNVTATGGTLGSYLQAFPAGVDRPVTANLLFGRGQTVPNLVTTAIGQDGEVALYNQRGTVDVVADVVGYFDPAGDGRFHAVTPRRLLDSRDASGPWAGTALGPASSRALVVTGSVIPDDASSLVANVTATGGSASSYLAASPAVGPNPAPTANLLYGRGQTIPNAVMVGIGTGHAVDLFNQRGSVQVIVDAAGYFAAT